MKTSNNNNATSANVVSKSSTITTEQKPVKTQRVLETREQWVVIFNHTVSLVAALAMGESLPEEPRKGFAFGKMAEQPHSRAYAQSLIGGFVSKKAGKVFAQTEGLQTVEERTKIALAILLKTKLGGADESKSNSASSILSKAKPKQAKTFAEAVLNKVQAMKQPSEVAPMEQKSKPSKRAHAKANASK